jgi:hypothetical protein
MLFLITSFTAFTKMTFKTMRLGTDISQRRDILLKAITSNFYLRNILIWLCYLLFFFILVQILHSGRPGNPRQLFFILLYFTGVFSWIVFHNRILIDKILLKKKPFWYFCSLMPGIPVWFLWAWLLDPLMDYSFNKGRETLVFIFFTTIGTLFYLSGKYFDEKKAFYQLTILNRDIELQQLKSQLNPHFLFNALNNIYSYTLYSNRFGNELILKLSELMRFILDSSEKRSIKITEEVRFIENYIAFENERLGERCEINFSKNILYAGREIAPLILFPFVENAFKYGSNTIQKTAVDIELFDKADLLKLIVKNRIINKNLPSTKKGLSMAARRLELLYPKKHSLLINNKDELFIVDLTIQYEKNQSADCR